MVDSLLTFVVSDMKLEAWDSKVGLCWLTAVVPEIGVCRKLHPHSDTAPPAVAVRELAL